MPPNLTVRNNMLSYESGEGCYFHNNNVLSHY